MSPIEVTPAVVATVTGAAFLIGFTKAGLGGGLGPAITALMVLTLPVEVALGLQLPMLIVGDAFSLAAFWKKWNWSHFRRLALGAVPGILAGTYLLASVDASTIQRLIGVVSLTFVAYRLLQSRLEQMVRIPATVPLGAAAGALGGVASTVAHAGGPPVAAYLLIARATPVEYAATHILLFAAINLLKVPGYVLTGFSHPGLALRLAPALLALPVGVAVGRSMIRRIRQEVFDRLILSILTLTGTYLIFGL